MPSKNIIRVSEFEKLFYKEDKPFKQKHWEALCRYQENANKQHGKRIEYFRILNKGIQFLNYVGVIQAGNLTIEVLPKTDKGAATAVNESIVALEESDEAAASNKQKWHSALLQMLKECRLLKVHHVDYANLKLRSNSILDIYIELFLSEAERLLHEGLLKKYQKQEGNQPALKGQLQFQKQLAHNSTHAERFYVRYTEYSRNNVYNRILLQTIQLIPHISNNAHLRDKAARLLIHFPELNPIIATAEIFNRLTYDRKTERYEEAMLIAKMLLLNYRPDITGGSENVIAILFDMNRLWEEWVYRRLKKEETNNGITVHRQQSKDFWKGEHMYHHKTVRPDMIIKKGDETIVIDTKWKLIPDMTPGDEDLKQMFVYNLYWNCNRSVLLYPATNPGHKTGSYKQFLNTALPYSDCTVLTTTIFEPAGDNLEIAGKLKFKFADEILKIVLF